MESRRFVIALGLFFLLVSTYLVLSKRSKVAEFNTIQINQPPQVSQVPDAVIPPPEANPPFAVDKATLKRNLPDQKLTQAQGPQPFSPEAIVEGRKKVEEKLQQFLKSEESARSVLRDAEMCIAQLKSGEILKDAKIPESGREQIKAQLIKDIRENCLWVAKKTVEAYPSLKDQYEQKVEKPSEGL